MAEYLESGRVAWFDEAKGRGYIAPSGGGPDVYVDATEVIGCDTLRAGQRVVFHLGYYDGEPRAYRVSPASPVSAYPYFGREKRSGG